MSFKVFFEEKKRICFSFYFFIIKWIYNKKFLSIWINQQNRFFFFLPQYHHLQLQHITFSFKSNNPIIKRITNTHFFSFFLFFFILFLQPSPSSFNQKTNKSKEKPQEWTHEYNIRFFFEGSKGISEVTSTLKNAMIVSAAWAHPYVRNNKDTKLWGLKIRVPFEAKGEKWIQNLFIDLNSLLRYNLKKVVQIA